MGFYKKYSFISSSFTVYFMLNPPTLVNTRPLIKAKIWKPDYNVLSSKKKKTHLRAKICILEKNPIFSPTG